jgi:hypothetical protein
MDYNIREMTIGDYEEALTLTICDLRVTIYYCYSAWAARA